MHGHSITSSLCCGCYPLLCSPPLDTLLQSPSCRFRNSFHTEMTPDAVSTPSPAPLSKTFWLPRGVEDEGGRIMSWGGRRNFSWWSYRQPAHSLMRFCSSKSSCDEHNLIKKTFTAVMISTVSNVADEVSLLIILWRITGSDSSLIQNNFRVTVFS